MRTSLVRVTLLLLCAFLFAGVVCSGLSVGGSERDGSLQPAPVAASAAAANAAVPASVKSNVRAPATKKTNSRKTTGSSSLTKPPATSKSTKVTKQRRKAKLITLTQLEKIAVKYEQQKNKPVKGVKPVQKSTKTAKNAASAAAKTAKSASTKKTPAAGKKTTKKSTAARALSELSSSVSTPPVAAAGIIPAGLIAQRMALRPGHGGDSQVLKGFHYTFDQSGRVTQVTGMVTFAKRGPLSDAAYLICDRMYFSDTNQTRDRDMWQTGHMLASALGGSDDDPQNFFPQHRNSNSAGGKWWRIESIARQGSVVLEKFKDKDGSQCKVQVTPTFEYAKPTWSATHGAYYVEATKACLDQITPAVQSTLSSYALIFSHLLSDPTATQNDIFQKSGNVGQRVGITWINEYDKADPKVNPGLFQ